MSVGKLSKKESVLMDRKRRRKHLLKKSTVYGFKRPENWGAEAQLKDVPEETVVEKKVVEIAMKEVDEVASENVSEEPAEEETKAE